jgi:hypothetical protein
MTSLRLPEMRISTDAESTYGTARPSEMWEKL